MPDTDIFKRCPYCDQRTWSTRDAFLADPEIRLIGYQAYLARPSRSLMLFNHSPCGTTLALPLPRFDDLYTGPRYETSYYDSERCEHRCAHVSDLQRCANPCVHAAAREVVQIILQWPKS